MQPHLLRYNCVTAVKTLSKTVQSTAATWQKKNWESSRGLIEGKDDVEGMLQNLHFGSEFFFPCKCTVTLHLPIGNFINADILYTDTHITSHRSSSYLYIWICVWDCVRSFSVYDSAPGAKTFSSETWISQQSWTTLRALQQTLHSKRVTKCWKDCLKGWKKDCRNFWVAKNVAKSSDFRSADYIECQFVGSSSTAFANRRSVSKSCGVISHLRLRGILNRCYRLGMWLLPGD